MATTKLTGTLIRSGSIPTWALGGGVITSSGQVANLVPAGTVSSSGQVSYTGLSNIPLGIVSSSTQVQPLLPGGTVSSSTQLPAGTVSASSQVQLSGITGTTFAAADFIFPQSLKVTGNLTATQFNVLSSSIIYTSGSTQFGDTPDDVMSVTGSIRVLSGSISGSMVGMFSASAQVVWSSVNYNSGIMSSSTQTVANLSGQSPTFSGSQFSSIVSGSGLAYRLIVPVGTNLYAT